MSHACPHFVRPRLVAASRRKLREFGLIGRRRSFNLTTIGQVLDFATLFAQLKSRYAKQSLKHSPLGFASRNWMKLGTQPTTADSQGRSQDSKGIRSQAGRGRLGPGLGLGAECLGDCFPQILELGLCRVDMCVELHLQIPFILQIYFICKECLNESEWPS